MDTSVSSICSSQLLKLRSEDVDVEADDEVVDMGVETSIGVDKPVWT